MHGAVRQVKRRKVVDVGKLARHEREELLAGGGSKVREAGHGQGLGEVMRGGRKGAKLGMRERKDGEKAKKKEGEKIGRNTGERAGRGSEK